MPAIKTGEYRLRFFDRYGTAFRDQDETHRSLVEARGAGEKWMAASENIASYSVVRAVFNSLDKATSKP